MTQKRNEKKWKSPEMKLNHLSHTPRLSCASLFIAFYNTNLSVPCTNMTTRWIARLESVPRCNATMNRIAVARQKSLQCLLYICIFINQEPYWPRQSFSIASTCSLLNVSASAFSAFAALNRHRPPVLSRSPSDGTPPAAPSCSRTSSVPSTAVK